MRRRAITGAESLTTSERRAAELAAEGMPNKQIAQTLFVTLRTVEAHLSNSYTKLHISSGTSWRRRSKVAGSATRCRRPSPSPRRSSSLLCLLFHIRRATSHAASLVAPGRVGAAWAQGTRSAAWTAGCPWS